MDENPVVTNSPWPMDVGSLILREPTPGDIDALLAFRNDEAVNRFMIRTSADPDTFRSEWLAVPDSDTDFSCVVELDGTVVAMGFLDVVDGTGQPGLPPRTEGLIGYIVHPGHWGRGIGAGVARGLLDAAFGPLRLRRVTAGCYADNRASVRILEGVGMRREQHGVADSWHAELGWVDGCWYAMLATEWRDRQQ
jgi:RimJ/RimL family protein N-acetyltransferase